MRQVTPKVFFLGQPELNRAGVDAWMEHVGGEAALESLDMCEGSDVEVLIQLMARRCYKSFAPGLNPNVTRVRTDSRGYLNNILNQRHGSVVAHGHVHYAFEDVSRVFTHEIVRNSIGTERSQESLRYVRLTDIGFWVPPSIASIRERTMVTMPDDEQQAAMTPAEVMMFLVTLLEWGQRTLASMMHVEDMPFSQKKAVTSAMRRVAPLGLATGIGMSFNLRALRWIIEQRTDPAAEEEMRYVFGLVAIDAIQRWPMIFQDVEIIKDTGGNWYRFRNTKI